MAPKTILPVPKAEPEVSVDLTEEPVMNLGHRDPKVRKKAVVLWVARGKKALPEIVEHLEHAYLGVRIGAWKVVQELHASKLPFDPWAPLPDRTVMIRALQDELPPQP
jgi:hypothetical protein